MEKVKVLGKRVLVEKEKLDVGGLKLIPTMDEDGQKNKGKIKAVGQIGVLNRLRGLKVGTTILFKKHFSANYEQDDPMVFVDVGEVLGIEK